MKAILKKTSAIAVLTVAMSNTAFSGAVVGSTEFTQIANNFELVGMYVQDARNLVTTINQYDAMLRNLENLDDFDALRSLIQTDIEALADIVKVGQSVAYSSSNIEDDFRAQNKGYDHYKAAFHAAGSSGTTLDYEAVYGDWAENNLNSTLGALKAANLQSENMEDESDLMADIQRQLQTASGAMQATQAAGAIAAQQVAQMQKLRELMMAQIQAQTTYQASQIERQAISDAAMSQFRSPIADPTKQPSMNGNYDASGVGYLP